MEAIELFSDGIGGIMVSGAIVRIDLVSLSATERDADNNPKPVFRQRIVMPAEAFANSVDLMLKALNGLIDAGAVRRVPHAEGAANVAFIDAKSVQMFGTS